MLGDARTVLAEFDVPKEKIHFELFYVDEPPPEVVHADKVDEGATSEVTVILDGRRTTSAMSQGKTILDSAQEARPDVPLERASCAERSEEHTSELQSRGH